MATVTFKGTPIRISGALPAVGASAPKTVLTSSGLADVDIAAEFKGKTKILNIFPSIDTGVCANSVRKFNEQAASLTDAAVLCISADLPFAQSRFCGAENIKNVHTFSTFRSSFAKDWGVQIQEGPLNGLTSRAVVVVDANDKVVYTEQVPEIGQEPNYAKALEVVKAKL